MCGELEKAIEYAILTCTGPQISIRDLAPEIFDKNAQSVPEFLNQGGSGRDENVNLREANFRSLLDAATIKEASQGFERIFLEHKLKQNRWNIQATAEADRYSAPVVAS